MSLSDLAQQNAQEIAFLLRQASGASFPQPGTQGAHYMGTSKSYYPIRAAQFGQAATQWLANHPDLSLAEFTTTLDCLSESRVHNEFVMIGVLIGRLPKLTHQLDPHALQPWLEHAEGWAEVDVICQSSFRAADVLVNWDLWQAVLREFRSSPNVHVRRASLVLLVRPVRESPDPRLSSLAFENIAVLETERDILITKAISWLLRSLVKYHRDELETYLEIHKDTLPKVAIRETRNKLISGRKSGKITEE
jgi:3-methyladenine DNA glycosylase AlkD